MVPRDLQRVVNINMVQHADLIGKDEHLDQIHMPGRLHPSPQAPGRAAHALDIVIAKAVSGPPPVRRGERFRRSRQAARFDLDHNQPCLARGLERAQVQLGFARDQALTEQAIALARERSSHQPLTEAP